MSDFIVSKCESPGPLNSDALGWCYIVGTFNASPSFLGAKVSPHKMVDLQSEDLQTGRGCELLNHTFNFYPIISSVTQKDTQKSNYPVNLLKSCCATLKLRCVSQLTDEKMIIYLVINIWWFFVLIVLYCNYSKFPRSHEKHHINQMINILIVFFMLLSESVSSWLVFNTEFHKKGERKKKKIHAGYVRLDK